MPQIEPLMSIINTTIQSSSDFMGMKFQHANWNLIGEDQRRTGAQDEIFPGIVTNAGEITELVPDDIYNLQIYHRLDSLEYTQAGNDKGPSGNIMQEIASCRLVLNGDRSKLNIRPEEIIAYMQLYFPKEISPVVVNTLNLNRAFIKMKNVDYDSYSVFNKEYKNIPYKLNPFNFMVDMSYSIVTTYTVGCFDIC